MQNDDHAMRIAHFAIHAIEAANSTLIDSSNPDLGTIQVLKLVLKLTT